MGVTRVYYIGKVLLYKTQCPQTRKPHRMAVHKYVIYIIITCGVWGGRERARAIIVCGGFYATISVTRRNPISSEFVLYQTYYTTQREGVRVGIFTATEAVFRVLYAYTITILCALSLSTVTARVWCTRRHRYIIRKLYCGASSPGVVWFVVFIGPKTFERIICELNSFIASS